MNIGPASEPPEQPTTREQTARDRLDDDGTDERARLNDERERLVHWRERLADVREDAADTRERLADERQEAADKREARLVEFEHRLDRRSRRTGGAADGPRQRAHEALGRAREQLDAGSARLDRDEQALQRSTARDEWEQRMIEREQVATLRAAASSDPVPAQEGTDERVRQLRARLLTAALDLAHAQDEAALRHEQLVWDEPDEEAESHRQRAAQARQEARWARALAQQAPFHQQPG
ncbi:hypothetical protein [Streptomyces sp. NPDC053560]|uniref:hypothetical protein n=1 Tax=Streptomyces sp. NPDC053560 TaxID=3365711 RepID=UPI0037D93697